MRTSLLTSAAVLMPAAPAKFTYVAPTEWQRLRRDFRRALVASAEAAFKRAAAG